MFLMLRLQVMLQKLAIKIILTRFLYCIIITINALTLYIVDFTLINCAPDYEHIHGVRIHFRILSSFGLLLKAIHAAHVHKYMLTSLFSHWSNIHKFYLHCITWHWTLISFKIRMMKFLYTIWINNCRFTWHTHTHEPNWTSGFEYQNLTTSRVSLPLHNSIPREINSGFSVTNIFQLITLRE